VEDERAYTAHTGLVEVFLTITWGDALRALAQAVLVRAFGPSASRKKVPKNGPNYNILRWCLALPLRIPSVQPRCGAEFNNLLRFLITPKHQDPLADRKTS
jgi:hypothetical protein